METVKIFRQKTDENLCRGLSDESPGGDAIKMAILAEFRDAVLSAFPGSPGFARAPAGTAPARTRRC
ncbi:hypothetical protein, partial [Stenotrophomonas maltophilia]|uniref:hypothetical protein n=1 Tax=Stenotrophomonas maltophilia TaxID=40324 RepID=UPI001954609C